MIKSKLDRAEADELILLTTTSYHLSPPSFYLSFISNFYVPLFVSWCMWWPLDRTRDVLILLTHNYYAGTNARSSSWRETRTQYYGSPRMGKSDEASPPDRNILVLVDFQDLQGLAHPRHPDHQEYSPIRSTFFSNATGIEKQALFLWAQQHTPAPARAQTLVGFCQAASLRLWAQWILTSTRTSWRSAIKTWMEIRSR